MAQNITQNKVLFFNIILGFFIFIYGCVSKDLRLPSNAQEVYKNFDIQQNLMLAATNNILFVIPKETLTDMEKTEVDLQCREFQNPFWAEKLSTYLNQMRRHPEWFSKFHVIELKKGDQPVVQLQKDLDGAAVLSIQYVLTEVRGKVTMNTQLPCQNGLLDYIGKDIVKTDFEFPTYNQMVDTLNKSSDKKDVARFNFKNGFLTYLAERGAIFKFNHEMSFEKSPAGQYVMAQALNKISDEISNKNYGYLNLWLKKINQNSQQAELIQMFGLVNESSLKAGVTVESSGEFARKTMGLPDLTYMHLGYRLNGDQVEVTPIEEFETCLQKNASDKLGSSLRSPAASEKKSYLSPGFMCLDN